MPFSTKTWLSVKSASWSAVSFFQRVRLLGYSMAKRRQESKRSWEQKKAKKHANVEEEAEQRVCRQPSRPREHRSPTPIHRRGYPTFSILRRHGPRRVVAQPVTWGAESRVKITAFKHKEWQPDGAFIATVSCDMCSGEWPHASRYISIFEVSPCAWHCIDCLSSGSIVAS